MRLLVGIIMLALQLASATAQDNWREFRADSDGFSIQLPDNPTITSRRIGDTKATQSMYLIERGEITYLVSVVTAERGQVPKNPDQAYYLNLMKNYAEGSGSKMRSHRMTTLAGRPAMLGITDGEVVHTVYLMASGDRVYLVVYAGQDAAPDALRMRNSFKLLK